MTPDQYREVRLRLGLTQAQLAALLGKTQNTISRREAGTRPIAKTDALAMRALLAIKEERKLR